MKTQLTIYALVLILSFSFFSPLLPETGQTAHAQPFHPSGVHVCAAPDKQNLKVYGVGSAIRLEINQILAFQIVNQPAGNPGYVSSIPDTLTQFSLADQYQSKGFLAHNYLAGASFSRIRIGDHVNLVYENQKSETYQITEIRKFQALSPYSPYSEFVDRSDGKHYSASELFLDIYDHPDRLVLQTCLEKNGVDTWGRVFIIGVPMPEDYIHLITKLKNHPLEVYFY
jgi:hypothetical protein